MVVGGVACQSRNILVRRVGIFAPQMVTLDQIGLALTRNGDIELYHMIITSLIKCV